MKAIRKATFGKDKVVDVWEVSQTGAQPDWVKVNFDKKAFQWDGKQVKCLMNVFKPSSGATFVGGNIYGVLYAAISDFIDGDNGAILTAKKFAQKYEIVEE